MGQTKVSTAFRENEDIEYGGRLRVNAGAAATGFSICDPTDSTKILIFDLSSLPTNTTDTFSVSPGGSEVTTNGEQTLTNKTLTAPILTEALFNGGDELGVALFSSGATADEGTFLMCIDEVVDLTGNAAKYKAMTTAIPAGSAIVSVQANIDAAVTGGGTTVKIGIGLNAGDVDAYGLSAALTKNAKINTIPNWAALSGDTTLDVCGVTSDGSALGDTNITAGMVRVRVVYFALTDLADT